MRGLDPQAGSWLEVYVGGEGKGDACTEFSSFECSGDGCTLYIGDNEGDLRVVDARVGKAVVAPVNVHSKRVNTVSMERGGTLLATACGDSTVCLWDLRKASAPSSRSRACYTARAVSQLIGRLTGRVGC